MKRKIFVVFLSIVAALCLAFGATACGGNSDGGQTDDGNTPDDGNNKQEEVIGTEGLEYTLLPDGESYALTGLGTAQGPEITIASHVDGKPVTQIGLYNFITVEDIPEELKESSEGELYELPIFKGESYKNNIDDSFEPSTTVNKVIIPNTVTTIGFGAFAFSDIESIDIPDGVTSIGSEAFSFCPSLASISISDSVTKIGDWAFEGCSGLTNVSIGNGVTSIGDFAFYGCTSLTSVTIPDGVTSIGDFAFYGCTSLTSINIPDSVTYIGDAAFSFCTGLTYKEYDNAYYLGNTNNPYVVLVKAKSTYITSCIINEKTKFICDEAFGYTSLKSITIPDGVTSIGDGAFDYCLSLTSITIPDSVTEIGNNAFYNCTSLTSITIPDSVTEIGWRAFSWCDSLESITIPDSVTSIEAYAFDDCSELTDIYFKGTTEQWNAIEKGSDWNRNTGDYTIHCTDGDIAKHNES